MRRVSARAAAETRRGPGGDVPGETAQGMRCKGGLPYCEGEGEAAEERTVGQSGAHGRERHAAAERGGGQGRLRGVLQLRRKEGSGAREGACGTEADCPVRAPRRCTRDDLREECGEELGRRLRGCGRLKSKNGMHETMPLKTHRQRSPESRPEREPRFNERQSRAKGELCPRSCQGVRSKRPRECKATEGQALREGRANVGLQRVPSKLRVIFRPNGARAVSREEKSLSQQISPSCTLAPCDCVPRPRQQQLREQ